MATAAAAAAVWGGGGDGSGAACASMRLSALRRCYSRLVYEPRTLLALVKRRQRRVSCDGPLKNDAANAKGPYSPDACLREARLKAPSFQHRASHSHLKGFSVGSRIEDGGDENATPKIPLVPHDYLSRCYGCGVPFHNDATQRHTPGFVQNVFAARADWLRRFGAFKAYAAEPTADRRTLLFLRLNFFDPRRFTSHDDERIARRQSAQQQNQKEQRNADLHALAFENAAFAADGSYAMRHEIFAGEEAQFAAMPADPLSQPPAPFLCDRCGVLRSPKTIAAASRTEGYAFRRYWCDAYEEVLRDAIATSNAVVVLVVDVCDFPAALPAVMQRLVGEESARVPFVLVGAKADALMCEKQRASEAVAWLRATASAMGLRRPTKTMLVSAKRGDGVDSLLRCIGRMAAASHRSRANVFLLGAANAGKSTLWNALLAAGRTESVAAAVTSAEPGTTAHFVSFPLASFRPEHGSSAFAACRGSLVDTPGVLQASSATSHLTACEIAAYLQDGREDAPRRPNAFVLRSGQSLFLGGVARVEFVGRPEDICVAAVVVAAALPIFRGESAAALALFEERSGCPDSPFVPPLRDNENTASLPSFAVAYENSRFASQRYNSACIEVALSGVGSVQFSGKVAANATIRVFTRGGVGAVQRPSPFVWPASSRKVARRWGPHYDDRRFQRTREKSFVKTSRAAKTAN